MKRTIKITLSRKDLFAEKYHKAKYFQISKEGGDDDFKKRFNQAIFCLISRMKEVDDE